MSQTFKTRQKRNEAEAKSASSWFAILVICSIWLIRMPIPGQDDWGLCFLGLVLMLAVITSGWQFMFELIGLFRPVGPLSKDEVQPESNTDN